MTTETTYFKMYPEFDETPTPVEPLTPIQSSGTYKIFQCASLEFINKLIPYKVPEANMMIEGLKHYVEIFSEWSPQNSPPDNVRKCLVDEFLELCGQVNIFLQSRKT